jgi:hypothetical protein
MRELLYINNNPLIFRLIINCGVFKLQESEVSEVVKLAGIVISVNKPCISLLH